MNEITRSSGASVPQSVKGPSRKDRPTLDAQSVSLWLAVVFGALLLLAFILFPGFFPPMSPGMSASEVASFYARHTTMIRTSMIIFNLCAIMLTPFFMVIVYQMKRMATPTQVLSYCYLSAAASGATLFAIADLFWLIAAFRPDRDPQLIMLLNDLAWITFTAPVGMIIAQNLCLARPRCSMTNPHRSSRDGSPISASAWPWSWHRPSVLQWCRADRWPGTAWCRSGCGSSPMPYFWSSCSSCSAQLSTRANGAVIRPYSWCGRHRTMTHTPINIGLADQAVSVGARSDKLDLWICWWVLPVFYTFFGVIFVLLAHVMPPPSRALGSADPRLLPCPWPHHQDRFRLAHGCDRARQYLQWAGRLSDETHVSQPCVCLWIHCHPGRGGDSRLPVLRHLLPGGGVPS